MAEALRIAMLGAECTGKSELTQALSQILTARTGLRVAAVGEWLRAWCDEQGRTPRRHEQADIAREQQRRIDAAAVDHDIVVCDTTPLMTAVYSLWYFDDPSLLPEALVAHRSSDLTLLTALDVPWQPDGLQRDGEQVRAAIDDLLRTTLLTNGVPFSVIQGLGALRAEAAWQALCRRFPQHLGRC